VAYSKFRYVGLTSCNSLGGVTGCSVNNCGSEFTCNIPSGSPWGAYPHYGKCHSNAASCTKQPNMPKLNACGTTWIVGACDDVSAQMKEGKIFSCGPNSGIARSHPTYYDGTKFQSCSPTTDEYQVCSINVPWSEEIWGGEHVKADVTNPYAYCWVWVP